MKQYKISTVENKDKWNSIISKFDNYHLLQTWQWGEIKRNNGWKASRLVVRDKKEDIAAFQLLTKRLHRRIPIIIGYVPKGPLFFSSKVNFSKLLSTVELAAKNRGCAYVKIDVDIDETTSLGSNWKNALTKNSWQYSSWQVQPKNTGITDLLLGDKDGENRLLMNMKKTWRYNIKLATKRGIQVRVGTSKDVAKFYELYKLTGERQGFGTRSLEYYREVYRAFHEGNDTDSLILLSEHKDEDGPLSAALFVKFHDKVWYLFAASNEKRRADMPNYPLQWEALKWARNSGAKVYDWVGASTNPHDPEDKLARVWHFKKGFGAQLFNGVGAWDKPIDTTSWYALTLLTKLQKLLKR